MKKHLVFGYCLLLAAVTCAPHHSHDDHSGHDHSGNDHSGHDHSGNDHSGNDHSGNDHSGNDHSVQDHDQSHEHHHHRHHHGHHDEDHGEGSAQRGPVARDCSVHLNAGHSESGILRIKPEGCHHEIDALCDMETDGGGWTVIQKRGNFGNAADYFYKTWDEYKNGFGELDKEFWIGNYHLNHLTEQGDYELRIDMWSLTDDHFHAQYGHFGVDIESRNYALNISNYTGDTWDCMSSLNGMSFSTHDRDNDLYDTSCAVQGEGAWWYKDCGSSNLNGPHMDDPNGEVAKSIFWFAANGNPILLKQTKMMVRPRT